MVTPRILSLISRYQLAALAFMAIGALFVDREIALGLLAGGALIGANFGLMRFLFGKALGGEKPSVAYGLLLGFKFTAVLGAMWLLVSVAELHPTGIALGLSTLFIGIGLGASHLFLRSGATP